MNPSTNESNSPAPPAQPPAPSPAQLPEAATPSSLMPVLWVVAVAVIVLSALAPWQQWFGSGSGTVVVYAAQDQLYAEPILKEFTQQSGIKVRPLFDSEAAKTVGLANRLLAERNRPQCDVFWGNEEMRTRQLAAQQVFRETNGWAAFGFRSRRIVVNTNKLSQFNASTVLALRDLTNQVWRRKVALAYPLFGSTATYFHTLRQHWGTTAWEKWCLALQANQPFVVDGNSVVVNLVGRGEAVIGLTDSDDIAAGRRQGFPITALPLTDETLMIPNTVAVVRGAPHPREAEQLFKYLQSRTVIEALLTQYALEGTHPGLRPRMQVNWDSLLRDLEDTNERLRKIFLR